MRIASQLSCSHRGAALLLSLTVPLLASCSSSGPSGGGAMGNVVIHDANNYSATSMLNIPVIQTKPAVDLSISWTGISQDLLCHPAGSIDNVAFLKIGNMSQAQVEQNLAVGKIGATQVSTYREFHTAEADGGVATSTMLSNLKYGPPTLMPATDYVESSTTQYVLLFTHGTTLAVGAQSMVFIQPTSGIDNTTVVAPDACVNHVLTFTPTLGTPVSIPAPGPWKLDWSQVTKDTFGNPLDFSATKLDLVEVGFYQGKTADNLQADFLNVEISATAIYSVTVPTGQKYVDLAGAATTGGVAFPGFASTDGTWAAAVRCTTCSVPAPVVFVILTPQPQ